MFDLDDLYKITCEEYYSYLNDAYGPDYEGGSTEETDKVGYINESIYDNYL